MTELANRVNDGVSVSLLWSRRRDKLTVAVSDTRSGEIFELDAPADKALDVFYHPYAYAAAHGIDTDDRLAAWGPIV
jgi:sugar lactone lactonase YvrE